MTIDTREIRAEPHVEVGALIESDAAVLVERWCRRAVDEQPDAKRVHADILRDQLPTFLRAMGRALAGSGNQEPGAHVKPAVEHGDQRWDNGWSLTDLVRDYQILQLVILEHLEETLKRPLRYREVMAVGVFINDAVAASIGSYVECRDEHLRRADQLRAEGLKQANRHKDEFIALLAHELRNPLAPIANSLKVLQMRLEGAPDPDVSKTLGVIDRQTRQLTRLVDDLLDLARIAQGRLELRRTRVELSAVLEQAVQTADPLIKARGQRLVVADAGEPLFLDADPARLVQIVVNLLHNAAKFTDRGGEIRLSAKRDGADAVLTVQDDGVGIPAEMTSRIFDMFVQVEDVRRHANGGLGVGLSLVQRLVTLHGGTVACRSAAPERGSEFTVRLPLHAGRATSGDAPPAQPELAHHPCHLLLIEDQEDARDALATLLRILGHRVDVAENGTLGIERAQALQPEVVLIDIGLPDIDGYVVAKRLRDSLGSRIFLIALTGYAQLHEFATAIDAGFDAHLVKPADMDELDRLLSRVPRYPPPPAAR